MKTMSFMLTEEQILNRTKTVTRRLGWKDLKPGTTLRAVQKSQGLKKGQKIKELCLIRVVSVRTERLNEITAEDVVREGFPDMSPEQFVDMFSKNMNCEPWAEVQRIEFEYVFNADQFRPDLFSVKKPCASFFECFAHEFTKPDGFEFADLVFLDPPFNLGKKYKGFRDRAPDIVFEEMIYSSVRAGLSWVSKTGVICLHGPDQLVDLYLNAMNYFVTLEQFKDLRRVAWVNWHYNFGECQKTTWTDARCHCLIYSFGHHKFNAKEVLIPSTRLLQGDKRVQDSEWKGYRLPGTVWRTVADGPNWGRIQGNNLERWNHSPNQLPMRYLERLIRAYTDKGDLVVDLFCGSGTTALVSAALDRDCLTCDVSRETVCSAAERFETQFDFAVEFLNSGRSIIPAAGETAAKKKS